MRKELEEILEALQAKLEINIQNQNAAYSQLNDHSLGYNIGLSDGLEVAIAKIENLLRDN